MKLQNSLVYLKLFSLSTALCFYSLLPISTYSFGCRIALWIIGVHKAPNIKENILPYDDKNYRLLVFNHPTIWDHLVLTRHLSTKERRMRFITFTQMMVWPIKTIFTKFGCVMTTYSGGTTKLIQDIVNNPKEGVIVIAPEGGITEPIPTKLATFKTGAFVPMAPILPVVIRYYPYEYHMKEETVPQFFMRRLKSQDIYYTIKTLPVISPTKQDTIETYRDRVKSSMETALQEMPDNIPIPENSHNYYNYIVPVVIVSIISFLVMYW